MICKLKDSGTRKTLYEYYKADLNTAWAWSAALHIYYRQL